MKHLIFSHAFASGKVVTIAVQRVAGHRPEIVGSGMGSLTAEEDREYRQWRNLVTAELMAKLSREELFACADFVLRTP